MLVIEVPDAVTLRVRSGVVFDLPPGPYAYVGSAAGAGGLAARVGRHMQPSKRLHWHIDHLLSRARLRAVLCFSLQVEECELGRHLDRTPGCVALAEFGCSDCRCRSHLFQLPEGMGAADLLAVLEGADPLLTTQVLLVTAV